MKKSLYLAVALIIVASVFRIVNLENQLWLNFGVFGAIALFSGSVIKNRSLAFLIPMLSYFLTDIYILNFTETQGFYGVSQIFTYVSMIFVVLLGTQMKKIKPLSVLGFSVAGSLVFWILSNFGVWFGNLFTQYEPGLSLGFTYFRALPFYNNFAQELFLGTFVGDVIANVALFGSYYLIQKSAQRTFAIK